MLQTETEATQVVPTKWTNTIFTKHLNESKIFRLPTLDEKIIVCKHYLNSLIKPKYANLAELTKYTILSCGTRTGGPNSYLFPMAVAGSEGGVDSIPCQGQPDVHMEPISSYKPLDPSTLSIVDFTQAGGANIIQSSQEEMLGMVTELWNGLDSEDPSESINFIAFYAMYTLRLSAKEPAGVILAMSTIREKFTNLFSQNPPNSLGYPSAPTTKRLLAELNKGNKGVRSIIPILIEAIYDPEASGIVRNSCLVNLAGVGLGLLTWYLKLLHNRKPEWMEHYLESVCDVSAYKSFVKAIEYLDIVVESRDITWRYARIIDDSALADYSTRYHTIFCSICLMAAIPNEGDRQRLLGLRQFANRDERLWYSVRNACNDFLAQDSLVTVKPVLLDGVLARLLKVSDPNQEIFGDDQHEEGE